MQSKQIAHYEFFMIIFETCRHIGYEWTASSVILHLPSGPVKRSDTVYQVDPQIQYEMMLDSA